MAGPACIKKILECDPIIQAHVGQAICVNSEMVINADKYEFGDDERKALAQQCKLLRLVNESLTQSITEASVEAAGGLWPVDGTALPPSDADTDTEGF